MSAFGGASGSGSILTGACSASSSSKRSRAFDFDAVAMVPDHPGSAGEGREIVEPSLAEHGRALERVAFLRQGADDLIAQRLHETAEFLDAGRMGHVLRRREAGRRPGWRARRVVWFPFVSLARPGRRRRQLEHRSAGQCQLMAPGRDGVVSPSAPIHPGPDRARSLIVLGRILVDRGCHPGGRSVVIGSALWPTCRRVLVHPAGQAPGRGWTRLCAAR